MPRPCAKVPLYSLVMAGNRRASDKAILIRPAPSVLMLVTMLVPNAIINARGSMRLGSSDAVAATVASERSMMRLTTACTTSALSA